MSKTTQPVARTICQAMGGDLASMTDDSEVAFVDSILYVVLVA